MLQDPKVTIDVVSLDLMGTSRSAPQKTLRELDLHVGSTSLFHFLILVLSEPRTPSPTQYTLQDKLGDPQGDGLNHEQ
jgi:hypothetical protein